MQNLKQRWGWFCSTLDSFLAENSPLKTCWAVNQILFIVEAYLSFKISLEEISILGQVLKMGQKVQNLAAAFAFWYCILDYDPVIFGWYQKKVILVLRSAGSTIRKPTKTESLENSILFSQNFTLGHSVLRAIQKLILMVGPVCLDNSQLKIKLHKYKAQNTKIQSTKYNKYIDTKIWTQERPALVLTKQPSQQYQTRGHSSSMSQSTIARQTLFLTKGKIARFPASDQEYRLSSKCQRGSDWLTPDDVTLRDIVTLKLAIVTSGRVEV